MSKKKLTKEEIEIISKLYESGKGSYELGKMFNCSLSTILKWLKKANIAIRKSYECKRLYTVDRDYFDKIDNSNKAYFLGLLYADGNVSEKKTSVSITLKQGDEYLIKLFNEDLKSNKPLYLNRKKYYKLEINSENLKKDLINLGCSWRKSHILKFPTNNIVPIELMWHFIRGYFDGDGCIYTKNRYLVNICGSYDFLNELKSFLEKYDIKSSLGEMKSIYQLQISNKKDFMTFFRNLYTDANISMVRKKEKYDKVSDCMVADKENTIKFLKTIK